MSPMRKPGVAQPVQQRHHRGDRRLVVGAQHAGAVAEDDLLADVGCQLGMLGRPQPDVLRSGFRQRSRPSQRRRCGWISGDSPTSTVSRCATKPMQGASRHRCRACSAVSTPLASIWMLSNPEPGKLGRQQVGKHTLARACSAGFPPGMRLALAGDGEIAEQALHKLLRRAVRSWLSSRCRCRLPDQPADRLRACRGGNSRARAQHALR